jgi:hypothetical protein
MFKSVQKVLNGNESFQPPSIDRQFHRYEGNEWRVTSLIEKSKELETFEKPVEELRALQLDSNFPGLSRDATYANVAHHVKIALAADLSYPILLGENGRIMDGHHRVLKALITGVPTLPVKQFSIDPDPDCIVK